MYFTQPTLVQIEKIEIYVRKTLVCIYCIACKLIILIFWEKILLSTLFEVLDSFLTITDLYQASSLIRPHQRIFFQNYDNKNS